MKNKTIMYAVLGLAVVGVAFYFIKKRTPVALNYQPSPPPSIVPIAGFNTAQNPGIKQTLINTGLSVGSKYLNSLFN